MPKRRMKRHSVTQPLNKSYRLIPLTKGQNAIVDARKFEHLSQWNWYASWNRDTKSFYARRTNEEHRHVWMHHVVLGISSKKRGDHKNHNTLDNRIDNLRKCTNSQNHQNQRKRENKKYKGTTWHKVVKRWAATICSKRRRKHLGYFISEEAAARAYDAAASKLFGKFACLNC
jgi:hypothetical protein